MLDLGWTELLVIGIVALIVIGPKDLPVLFRKVGHFVGRAKGMAREFSRAMDQAASEAGVDDVQKSLKAATNPLKTGMDQVKAAASTEFEAYNPLKDSKEKSEQRVADAKKIQEATRKREASKASAQKDETEASASQPIAASSKEDAQPAAQSSPVKDDTTDEKA